MAQKESSLKNFFSKAKPTQKDCCSVEIEEVESSQENCSDSTDQQKKNAE
ncbi:alcohol dehydrogenase [Salicibibacter cibi]|uniref:Alcohol dehydrogenase n=1 Tax=Salicibibacter cibi TaxID=2743001 RepID=A0A7T6Z929_9BACI|nr:alcohol dehydrogenase [Salicibibacter cibi]QQK79186.1 alcohol dehydrogenase [Salicibibacter cibi]